MTDQEELQVNEETSEEETKMSELKDKVLEPISKILNDNDVSISFLAIIPEKDVAPVLLYRGGLYNAAKLSAHVAGLLKQQVLTELET